MSHNPRGQGVAHHVHHGPEAIPGATASQLVNEKIVLKTRRLTFADGRIDLHLQCPVDSDDQRDVVGGQPHGGQYDHHGYEPGLWDSCGADAGGGGGDAERRRFILFTASGYRFLSAADAASPNVFKSRWRRFPRTAVKKHLSASLRGCLSTIFSETLMATLGWAEKKKKLSHKTAKPFVGPGLHL